MSLLKKLTGFFSKPAIDPQVLELYNACVTQSRRAEFYRDMSVPDTVDGRFDLLLLHVILVMRRLGTAGESRQRLFDLMFADMDRNLREMGVGDMSVGKKIKPMLAAFYGRFQAYESGLANGDDALMISLKRNLYNDQTVDAATLTRMATYVHNVVKALDAADYAAVEAGDCDFPVLHA